MLFTSEKEHKLIDCEKYGNPIKAPDGWNLDKDLAYCRVRYEITDEKQYMRLLIQGVEQRYRWSVVQVAQHVLLLQDDLFSGSVATDVSCMSCKECAERINLLAHASRFTRDEKDTMFSLVERLYWLSGLYESTMSRWAKGELVWGYELFQLSDLLIDVQLTVGGLLELLREELYECVQSDARVE